MGGGKRLRKVSCAAVGEPDLVGKRPEKVLADAGIIFTLLSPFIGERPGNPEALGI